MYEDTLTLFQKLKRCGIPIYIYSSGSIDAQKLLFGYSIHGDLVTYLKGHFDTTSGAKTESISYGKIFQQLKSQDVHLESPNQVLFITDNILEAEAATKAGMLSYLTDRPGNKPLPEKHPFRVITTFDQLFQK